MGNQHMRDLDYENDRFLKVRVGFKQLAIQDYDTLGKIELLYGLVRDHALGEELNASISFPGNWGLMTTESDREITRLIIFLTHFEEALERASDLDELRDTRLLKTQPLPPPRNTSAFNKYIRNNISLLQPHAKELVQNCARRVNLWTQKFNPQRRINMNVDRGLIEV